VDRFSQPGSGRENGSHGNSVNGNQCKSGSHGNNVSSQSKPNNQESSAGRAMSNQGKCDNTARPGSGLFRVSTPEMKVRNPNYTPTKPYSEVSDPNVPVSESSKAATTEDIPRPETSQKRAASSCPNTPLRQNKLTFISNVKKPPIPAKKQETMATKDGQMKKISTMGNGTVFYRKSSKAEEVIHDLKKRPLAEGAPAKTIQGERLTSEDDDEEWTTDEEEGAEDDSKPNKYVFNHHASKLIIQAVVTLYFLVHLHVSLIICACSPSLRISPP
jgi:hypothetical protein